MEGTYRIARLSPRGDGVAEGMGREGRVYLPFTLPGETLRAEIDEGGEARVTEIVEASAQRVTPPCVHFGICGGCDLQHAADSFYAGFKTSLLRDVLRRLDVAEDVLRPLLRVPPGARRRAEFAVDGAGPRVGFTRRRSHDVFDLAMCPVTRAEIVAILPRFRACLAVLPKPGRVASLGVDALPGGLDLRIAWKGTLRPAERDMLRDFGRDVAALRLSVRHEAGIESVHAAGEVVAEFGGVAVEWPVGAFRQATAEGEAAILARVRDAVAGAARVADIYAGCGAYSLPLAQAGHRVTAWEGDEAMVSAMLNAARRAGIDDRLEARVRDLQRDPLPAEELRRCDAVVINPPRNGAGPQMARIAESGVARVAVVSCHPATFERDARILLAHGYRLVEATPIDQFLWSHHLELVARFDRA